MLHHQLRSTDRQEAELRDRAARRRPPADAGELERLVLRAAAGDAAAWTPLVERFTARIRAVARAHRLAPSDADDVVQDTWLRLFENIGRLRDSSAVGSWLGTTARRQSLHLIAHAKRERPSEQYVFDDDDGVEDDPSERLVAAEQRTAMTTALGALSERQRALLTLLFHETEPSYAEISSQLGMPIGSIGPTRARALERLGADPQMREVVDPEPA